MAEQWPSFFLVTRAQREHLERRYVRYCMDMKRSMGQFMYRIVTLSNRSIVVYKISVFVLATIFHLPARAESSGKDIVRVDRKETPTERAQYPSEMVVKDNSTFDGSYMHKSEYKSADRKFTVALWESGPGILKTDAYPHDEYCLVLGGHLTITNRNGSREEFGPGDTFVIPKGWAGTWNMTTRFKKQYVAVEETQKSAGR